MITIFVEKNGVTEKAARFDRAWLNPASGVHMWVDLAAPSIPESLILSDTFNFHRLSVEDAMSARQYPKAEAYDGYRADDVMIFQDRITGMLDAHLSNVSNRLNEVMKVLTVVSTVLMPLTLLTSVYGMNVPLPQFPGGERIRFWWIFWICVTIAAAMLAMFRRKR